MKHFILTYQEFITFKTLCQIDNNYFDCVLRTKDVLVTTNIEFCEKYNY